MTDHNQKQSRPTIDQTNQTIQGNQTNVAGGVHSDGAMVNTGSISAGGDVVGRDKIEYNFYSEPTSSPYTRLGQRYDFYAHIHLSPNFVPRTELMAEIKQGLLPNSDQADGNTIALTSAIKGKADALHGMGGIGKTVMARALCDDEEVRDAFPDGILWATLGQTPGQDLDTRLRDWIGTLGGTIIEIAPSRESLKNILANLLSERRCLLIVDDVWHPDHARWFQFDVPGCRLLMTTRDAETARRLGAIIHTVPVMTEPDAIALLCQWGGDRVAGVDPKLLKTIVDRLGRLPLAIKLAGSQLNRRDNAEEWLQRFDAQQLKEKRVYETHDSLAATFVLSLDELSKEERYLYASLTILKQDVGIPQIAVESLWIGLERLESEAVVDQLADLADRALIEMGGSVVDGTAMIIIHDLLRDFMVVELGETGAVHAHRRLLAQYRQRQRGGGWHTVEDDGYLYDHLAYHLGALAMDDEVAKQELSGLFANQEWMHVRVPQNGYTYAGYIADLTLAWGLAYQQTLEEIDQNGIPKTLGTCVRYALIRSWISSVVQNVPADLITLWARMGETDRAIACAHIVPDSYPRHDAYIAIAAALCEQGDLNKAKDLLELPYQETIQNPASFYFLDALLKSAELLWTIDKDRAKHIVDKVADQVTHKYNNRSLKYNNRSLTDFDLCRDLCVTAEILYQFGDCDRALDLLEDAHVIVDEYPYTSQYNHIGVAESFVYLGKTERASKVLEQLTQMFEEEEWQNKVSLVDHLQKVHEHMMDLPNYAVAFSEQHQSLANFTSFWQKSVEALEQAGRFIESSDTEGTRQLIQNNMDAIETDILDRGLDITQLSEEAEPDPLICIYQMLQIALQTFSCFRDKQQGIAEDRVKSAVDSVKIRLKIAQGEQAMDALERALADAPTILERSALLEMFIKALAIFIEQEDFVRVRSTLADIVLLLNQISERSGWLAYQCQAISANLAGMEPPKFIEYAWPELQAIIQSDAKFHIVCCLPAEFEIPHRTELLTKLIDQAWRELHVMSAEHDKDYCLLAIVKSAACRHEPRWLSALESRIDDIQFHNYKVQAYCTLAQAWLAIGNRTEAVALVKRIQNRPEEIGLLDTKISLLLRLSQIFIKSNQINYAEQLVEVASDYVSRLSSSYQKGSLCEIAELWLQLSKHDLAREVAEKVYALSTVENTPQYLPRIGKILLKIGDNQAAQRLADELMAEIENSAKLTVSLLRETVEFMVAAHRSEMLSRLLDIAVTEDRSKKERKFNITGIIAFTEIVFTEIASIFSGIGKALHHTGQIELALEAALLVSKNLSQPGRNFAPLLEIIPLLKADSTMESEIVESLVRWVESWQKDKIREAWALSKIAVALVSESALTRLLLDEVWLRLNTADVTIQTYTLVNLAWIYANLGDIERAQEIAEDSLIGNLSPDDNTITIGQMGTPYIELLTHLGQYQKTLEMIQKQVPKYKQVEAYKCMINILVQIEEIRLFPSVTAHVEACMFGKSQQIVLSYIAKAYAENSYHKEAIQLFHKAMTYACKSSQNDVYELLDICASALNNLDQGETLWEVYQNVQEVVDW